MAQTVTAATQAAPEGVAHEAAFPPFASETFASQLLWFTLAFGLLYYLMSRVALPRIGAVLEDRTTRLARTSTTPTGSRPRRRPRRRPREVAGRRPRPGEGDRAGASHALTSEAEAQRKTLEAELPERLAASEPP